MISRFEPRNDKSQKAFNFDDTTPEKTAMFLLSPKISE